MSQEEYENPHTLGVLGVLGDQRRCLWGPLLLMSANSAATCGSSTWLVLACMAFPYFSLWPVPGLHNMLISIPTCQNIRSLTYSVHVGIMLHQCNLLPRRQLQERSELILAKLL